MKKSKNLLIFVNMKFIKYIVNVTKEMIITFANVLLLKKIHNYMAYFVDKKILRT